MTVRTGFRRCVVGWLGATCAVAALFLAPALPAATPKRPATIAWQTDYAAAAKQARALHRPLFVDFYADWCGPCQEMAKTTFRDPRVVQTLSQFVCLRVNVDKGSPLVARYHVSGIPRVLVLDATEQPAIDVTGYVDAGTLLELIRGAATKLGMPGLATGAQASPVLPAPPPPLADPLAALGDPDRQVRERASQALRAQGPRAVPSLLAALTHPHLAVRLSAHRVLVDAAHPPNTLRYDPWAAQAVRRKQAAALRTWWQQRGKPAPKR